MPPDRCARSHLQVQTLTLYHIHVDELCSGTNIPSQHGNLNSNTLSDGLGLRDRTYVTEYLDAKRSL